ncbi:unnamed protein product [Allacma fusca]|uniref:Uncharacterized protein n=1 Tax=Allacma fusca TaxID=39272 RepID=A0A8J2J476_9HEXA|nr:unnamed protein product [Allacma fusca]
MPESQDWESGEIEVEDGRREEFSLSYMIYVVNCYDRAGEPDGKTKCLNSVLKHFRGDGSPNISGCGYILGMEVAAIAITLEASRIYRMNVSNLVQSSAKKCSSMVIRRLKSCWGIENTN